MKKGGATASIQAILSVCCPENEGGGGISKDMMKTSNIFIGLVFKIEHSMEKDLKVGGKTLVVVLQLYKYITNEVFCIWPN